MMAMSERNHPGCVAESPLRHGRQAAAGGTSLRGFFIFFARSAQARHVLVEEGTQSIFIQVKFTVTLPPSGLS